VVLKSKHEALLARIPMSVSTPNTHSRTSTIRLSHSASESGLAGPFTNRTRKVSIAMADVSLLADQNAELLDKLQRLEEDATSADVAGRRELKRLEKEIAYLRDALEKTQAKSEELEGKVHDAVTSDALRRKKEREAARHAERDVKQETNVLNFAPPGSKFGGPTERYTFINAEGSPNNDRQLNTPGRKSDVHPNSEDTSDRALISQLLNKVKELEETNDRILQHQAETSNQLASVQQDAMNISKIYEFLSDDDAVELEWNPDGNSSDYLSKDETDPPTIRFRSLRRSIENTLSADGGFFYPGGNLSTKARKSVVGLFDDSRPTEGQPGAAAKQMTYSAPPSMSETHDRSSWTPSSSSAGAASPGPLSPLNFFSPLSQSQSDIPQIPTLQNELESKLGRGSWNWPGATHIRTESLSNLSQFSAPPTPSPAPGSINRMLPEELDHASKLDLHDSGTVSGLCSVEEKATLTSGNLLELSVEPPTPDVNNQNKETPTQTALRLQHISQTLRSRKNRWAGRVLKDRKSRDALNEKFSSSSTSNSDLSRQHSDAVVPQAGDISIDTEVTKAESSECDKDTTHNSPSGTTTTPQSRRSAEDPLTGQTIESAVCKRHEQDGELIANKSFLFQVWLWIQFVVVVFFFIFAMAKRGPRSVLVAGGDERLGGKRSVTRR
jgi:hypothetical protein